MLALRSLDLFGIYLAWVFIPKEAQLGAWHTIRHHSEYVELRSVLLPRKADLVSRGRRRLLGLARCHVSGCRTSTGRLLLLLRARLVLAYHGVLDLRARPAARTRLRCPTTSTIGGATWHGLWRLALAKNTPAPTQRSLSSSAGLANRHCVHCAPTTFCCSSSCGGFLLHSAVCA